MFRRLYEDLTWFSKFDTLRRFAREYTLFEISGQGLDEKLSYWREDGKLYKLTPEQAIERAVLEYCEDFRKAKGTEKWAQTRLSAMAHALAKLKQPVLIDGKVCLGADQLSEFWREQHLKLHSHSLSGRNNQRDEDDW